MPVLVVIQFGEDFFEPIEFILAQPAIVIAIKQFKEPRHRASSAFPFGTTIPIARRLAIRATPFWSLWSASFGSTISVWTTISVTTRFVGFASITTSRFSTSFTVRLPISLTTWLICFASFGTTRFGTSFAFWFAFRIRSAFPFASLSKRAHVIERQYVLLQTVEHRLHAITKLSRNFFERHFAVTVRVHAFEPLFGSLIWPATTVARNATWLRTQFRHRAAELFLRQLILTELLKHFAEPLTQPFRQFILLQLAIVVLVEPFQELDRCPAWASAGSTTRHSLSGLFEVFCRDRIFVLAFHHLAEESSRPVFGDLVLLQLTVFVFVEPFEHLFEVDHWSATWTTRPTIRTATLNRSITALNRGGEFRFRQFAIVVLVPQSHEPIKEPTLLFRNFIRHQFAVVVLVELLEKLFLLCRLRLFCIVLSKRCDRHSDQPRREQSPKIDPLHNVVPDEWRISWPDNGTSA